jgi:predicted transcriptional regulator
LNPAPKALRRARFEVSVPSAPKGLSTRLQLLLEIHNHRHGRLQPLADRLGVTVQNVSMALKRLGKEGLVENRDGDWRPTQRGTDALHGSFRDLQRFVEDAMTNLRLIDECVAQADAPIKSGDRVGLYMRDGRLCAAPRVYATSQGRARERAATGDAVRIGDLRGIVALRPAPITFVGHPVRLSAAQEKRARRLVEGLAKGGRVAAHELGSVLLLESLQRRPDLEFAPLAAALDAARRGVPVQYWVPAEHLSECLAQAGQTNGSAHSPSVRSVEL